MSSWLLKQSLVRMIVEAIGRKGANVRLTVKRESLREPQPDLFA
jgi:hypothetical protein